MKPHRVVIAAGLYALVAVVNVSAQATTSAPVTEAALRSLCSEPSRVIVVLSAANVYMALSAGSVTKISGSTLEIAEPADSIVIANNVRVLGEPPSERPVTAADVVDVLTSKWGEDPFPTGGASFWQLGDGTRKPGEFLQIKKGETQPGLKIAVTAILTWWCEEPGPECKNPSR
ncbi:MAG: hypothetical protein WD690_00850 [Vicinamibacterales bacterium]